MSRNILQSKRYPASERESTGERFGLRQSIPRNGNSYGAIAEAEPAFESGCESAVSLVLSKSDPVVLTWEKLNVYVPGKKNFWRRQRNYQPLGKQLLKDANGIVCPGQLVALMGASGAGKTTLINTLTGRNRGNLSINGSIKVNGAEIGSEISSISAYVQQEDLFVGTLTVNEHLIFQALLRLPNSFSYKEKIQRANEVLFELGLTKCKDTKIGVPGIIKGISGGESKRLAFASEIITDPPLLFCDEPTTGLDSYMAENVVAVLQALAAKGKTILITIQQPPSEVYAMFDRVFFMAEGRTAFLGKARNALKFFKECNFLCPDDFNPSDHIIQTLAVVRGQEQECKERISKLCDAFEASKYARQLEVLKQKAADNDSQLQASLRLSGKSKYKAAWFVQFCVLLWRATLNNYRNRSIAVAKILLKIVKQTFKLLKRLLVTLHQAMGIFIGLIYLQTPIDQRGVMNINGALFFFLQEISLAALYGVLFFFYQELPVLCREHHDGMYKVSSYYYSKIISLVPVFSIDGILFVVITYWMIGLRPSLHAFLVAIGIGVLVEQAAVSFGCFVSAATPSFPVTLSVIGPTIALFQMLGGLYANVGTLPDYISWLSYLSWFRTGYSAFTINQWHNFQGIACSNNSSKCMQTGDDVLKYKLSFEPAFFAADLLILAGCTIMFHLLGYLSLWHRVNKRR